MRRPSEARPALRLVHYWWPVLMGGSTAMVVDRATGRPVDGAGLALFASGILAAYSLDRILDRPDMTPGWLRATLHAAALAGIAADAVLLALVPVRTAALVPVLGVLVLAYRRLKALPVLKTVVVSAAWTWGVIALPFPDGSWVGWTAWTEPVAIPLMLLIASGCLLCDLKDEQADRSASVASLPALMGGQRTAATAMMLAALGAAVALVEQRTGLLIAGVALAAVAIRPERLARDATGPLLVDVILTLPGVLITLRVV